jgi:uncharacterized protein YukE
MKKSLLTIALTTLIIGTLITSCNSSAKKVEDAAVKVDDATEELKSAKEDFNYEYNKFKVESEQRMLDNEFKIAELKANKVKLKKEAKEEYDKTIADLEEKNSSMRTKLNDYKEEGKDKWESFKREFNRDMDELVSALKDLANNNVK